MGLLRTELVKQFRRPRTWVAIGFVILVPIIITVALKTNPPDLRPPRGGGDGGPRFFALAPYSGLIVPLAALRVMSNFFLVVIFCMFMGDAIAAESGWGNLRFLLTRPIGRGKLLASKFVVAALSSTLMPWLRASGAASPTVDLSEILPWRGMAPVRNRSASRRVVLPLR